MTFNININISKENVDALTKKIDSILQILQSDDKVIIKQAVKDLHQSSEDLNESVKTNS